jgi:MurNAc alpha-1-phosphate uridylyltransferase
MPGGLTGLILAGGLGTRMRPLTLHTPKCLVEINGRQFLDYQLALLAKNGVSRVVLSTGYLGRKIEEYLQSHPTHGIEVQVSHEKEQLGTGGSIINALPLLPEEFFLMYGDSYLLQPISQVYAAFRESGKLSLMAVLRQSGGTSENNCGVENGVVVRYAKGQPAGTFDFMDYGLLFFRKEALKKYTAINFPTDVIFADLIADQQLAAFETRKPYYEVGSKEGLRNFTRYIQSPGR